MIFSENSFNTFTSIPYPKAYRNNPTQAMPNGFDPVWMETVRIEIARDRLRHLRDGRKGSSDGGDGENHVSDNDTDFSVIVWNCGGNGRRRSRRAKVGAGLSVVYCVVSAREASVGINVMDLRSECRRGGCARTMVGSGRCSRLCERDK